MFAILIALGAGCGGGEVEEDTAPRVVPEYVGRDWNLVSAEWQETWSLGVTLYLKEDEYQCFEYIGDLMSFTYYGGCNWADGNFEVVDGRMMVSCVGVTELGCGGELPDKDEWFYDFFDSNPLIDHENDTLPLSNDNAVLTFEEVVEE